MSLAFFINLLVRSRFPIYGLPKIDWLEWGYTQVYPVEEKYVTKKSSTAPILKYTSHRYENMHFVPDFRRISASGTLNKTEKIIHILEILQCSLYLYAF